LALLYEYITMNSPMNVKSKHCVLNVSKAGLLRCSLVSNEILSEATHFDRVFCHHHRVP